MALENKQMLNAEESVILFADATGLSEKEVVDIFVSGLTLHYRTSKFPDDISEIIDELRATFDAY